MGVNSSKIAINSLFLFFRMALVMGVTLFTSRVILKVLGFEDYGIYNVVGSIVVFFGFLRTALTNATFRFITYELGTKNQERLNKVYSMAINSHLILATCIFVTVEFIGVWFLNNKLNIDTSRLYSANIVFQFSLLSFCLSIIQTPFHSNIIAHEKMSFYAILSLLEVGLRLLIAYILLISPIDKLVMYGILTMIVTSIVFICYILYNHFVLSDVKYEFMWDLSLFKNFANYSGWSLLVNTADVCTQQSISIFFNLFLGVLSNAALGIANQVNSALNSFLQNFVQACNPQIVKSYASNEYNRFLQLVYSSSKISYLLLLLVAIPILINTDFILTVWLDEYPEHTTDYIIIIMFYYLIDAFQTALWQAMHATGKIKQHQIIIGMLKVINIPLIYICLSNTHSGEYALLIWVIINVCCAIFRTIYMKHLINLNLRFYLKDVFVPIIVTTVIVYLLSSLIIQHISNQFIAFVISSLFSISLTCVLTYTYCFNKNEKLLVKQIINKIISKNEKDSRISSVK